MFLEHLASDNGADMHKYNTLYTHRLIVHVLSPPPKNYKNKNKKRGISWVQVKQVVYIR